MNYIKKNINFPTQHIKYYIKIDTSSSHRIIGINISIKQQEEKKKYNEKIQRLKRAETNIPELKKPPKEQKIKVILIYIDDYNSELLTDAPLVYSKSDAMLLEKYFNKTFGVDSNNIHHYYNGDATISAISYLFKSEIPNWAKDGFTDFYVCFQGHGYADKKGTIYFLPWDTQVDNGGNINTQMLDSLEGYFDFAINNSRDSSGIQINLFAIFDACASYSADKSILGRNDKTLKTNNLSLITASKIFEVAKIDHELEHSLLTYAFVLALSNYEETDKNNDDKITFLEIYYAAKKYVKDRSKAINIYHSYVQVPEKFGQGQWNKEVIDIKKLKK
jgi:hypothetical protein